jgi:uncharacterized protein with PQ loop repeat
MNFLKIYLLSLNAWLMISSIIEIIKSNSTKEIKNILFVFIFVAYPSFLFAFNYLINYKT